MTVTETSQRTASDLFFQQDYPRFFPIRDIYRDTLHNTVPLSGLEKLQRLGFQVLEELPKAEQCQGVSITEVIEFLRVLTAPPDKQKRDIAANTVANIAASTDRSGIIMNNMFSSGQVRFIEGVTYISSSAILTPSRFPANERTGYSQLMHAVNYRNNPEVTESVQYCYEKNFTRLEGIPLISTALSFPDF